MENAMSSKSGDIRVRYQPIRDRRCQVAAFELLHRYGDALEAHVTDDAIATDEVLHQVYTGGVRRRAALGPFKGFINVDAEMLLSSCIESLPRDQVVLELLETVDVDERVIGRCSDLKQLGFHLALDDFCDYREDLEPLLDLADIVKVDLLQVEEDRLEDLVRLLRRFPLQLLAEKVDSNRSAQRCRELQFDLYQGYYFDAPAPAAGYGDRRSS